MRELPYRAKPGPPRLSDSINFDVVRRGRTIFDITLTAHSRQRLKVAVHITLGNEDYTDPFKPQGDDVTADCIACENLSILLDIDSH